MSPPVLAQITIIPGVLNIDPPEILIELKNKKKASIIIHLWIIDSDLTQGTGAFFDRKEGRRNV
jgi:hypothetical protein